MYLYLISGPDDLLYVGITNNPKERWKSHRKDKANKPLYRAMRALGRDNFQMIVISQHDTVELAKQAEIDMIKLLGTQDRKHGFNISPGGDYDSQAGIAALREKLATDSTYFQAFSLRCQKNTKAQWAARTPEQKQDVCEAISKTLKDRVKNEPEFAALQRERMLSARAKGDVAARGRAASAGIKRFWVELRADPERYAEYIARRRATLMETIDGKRQG